MIQESFVISYSTPNYNDLFNICIGSLIHVGFKNEQIKHFLDSSLDNENKPDAIFRSKIWYKCILNKVLHVKNMLLQYKKSEYKYFIFTDCDIRFIEKNKHCWEDLKLFIDSNGKDIYFTDDRSGTTVNSGFYIIKNNENINTIIDFFNNVVDEMMNNNDIESEDQVVINKLKHTVNFGYIPREYIVLGINVDDKEKVILHHAVGDCFISGKVNQMIYIKNLIDP
jgi:hypothetical protein